MAEKVIAKNVHAGNEDIAQAEGKGNILLRRVNIFGYHPLGHVIFFLSYRQFIPTNKHYGNLIMNELYNVFIVYRSRSFHVFI